MIRLCHSKDHESIFPFLLKEKAFNLFLIGDIENFGYDSDFQDVWAEFDDVSGEVRAVMLRYFQYYLFYANGDFDKKGFADILVDKGDFELISGKAEVIAQMSEVSGIPFGREDVMHFAELGSREDLKELGGVEGIKKADVGDVDRLCDLRASIKEFVTTSNSRDSMKKTFETKSGRAFYVEENEGGRLLASASTTAENTYSAMVVGVATHPEHRRSGYANALVQELCKEVLSEGKSLCLFYDNPAAGNIYKRLGFKEIGLWTMVHRAHGNEAH